MSGCSRVDPVRKIIHFGGVEKGDVLMVVRQMTDKKTGKPYVWRFFALIVLVGYSVAKTRILGNERTSPTVVSTHRDEVHLLEPDEWPDGVHMFRTQMILKGEIELD